MQIDSNQFLPQDQNQQKKQRELLGIQDARGPVGILSRGKPIYRGGSNAAHMGGGPQFGRPRNGSMQQHENAIARRLGQSYGNQ